MRLFQHSLVGSNGAFGLGGQGSSLFLGLTPKPLLDIGTKVDGERLDLLWLRFASANLLCRVHEFIYTRVLESCQYVLTNNFCSL